MRIAFDAKRLYNNFTGLGNYSRTLLHGLSELYPNDEYYLYTPKIKETPETAPFYQNGKFNTILPDTVLKGFWRSCGIKKDLRHDKIELYHGLSHEIPLNIHKTGIRSVVTIHDIIYKTYPDMFTAIDRTIYDLKFRYSCKHADKIIAISESTKNDIIRYLGVPPEKIEVIYQAINPLFYQMQTEQEAKTIVRKYNLPEDFLLYVGSINSRKNLMSAVKALAILPPGMQIPLVIIGKGGAYKNEVLKFAAEHRLEHLLILIDNLADSKALQAFYQMAKIFIFPSIYEGFGLPVTEALLSKVPVITTNVSSLPEAGGKHSWYVSPTDTEGIAKGIETILADDIYRQNIIEEGYRFAHEKFKPSLLTEKVHTLYKSLR